MTSPTLTPVTLVGATGLTGSASLRSLLLSTHPFNLTVLSRRPLSESITPRPSNPSTTLSTKIHEDLFAIPTDQSLKVSEKGGIYVSALGTTRAKAGGTANQERVDLGLNRDLAKRAKEDGADTMILVSTGGANHTSSFFYMRIKGQLEEDIKSMGFSKVIILRPGALLGERTESRPAEWLVTTPLKVLRKVGLNFNLSTQAEDVGACIAELAANPPSENLLTLYDDKISYYAKKYRETNPSSST
ncbi:hypothetical protein I302_108662 [Kwoniella bestiolae CBS 10118]|uniref:Endoplasmic reticulum protein n=1 Tax=Kwoniella bestiolae CBS 10118 TaxID=1296100 RepID=A0A1B9FTQ4_9TREE|nr:hypothetical protein I302_07798 [Kwoniella bestiolae CBS 10118]OCF22154.1 hypothetical protein I302_07798 [Kwoniella bestiolae CBS 10118]